MNNDITSWLIKNRLIIMLYIIVIFVIGTSNAALDCSKCHITDIGTSIIARDTIEISNKTCMKCHNLDYPPTPIGYNTHLAHIGKYSVKVDYLKRHPKVADSINCNSCHTNIGNNCRNCHIKNIPHIQGDIGRNCKGCHGELDKLFRHPSIEVKIHNIFGTDSNNTAICEMCHNSDDMKSLKLANGRTAPIQEPHRLCFQCHSDYYRLWDAGSHYSNKTIPKDDSLKITELKNIWENGWRIRNTCTNCHNPHNPNELYQLPRLQEVKEMTGISNILTSKLIYIMGTIISIVVILIILKNKETLKKLISKISKISISIPISISVEKIEDKTEKIEDKTEKVEDKTEKVEDKTEKVEDKTEKKIKVIHKSEKLRGTFLHKYKGDILFISIVGIIFLTFYVVFGAFMPISVVISDSMSPHIEKGDIIFFTDISRIDDINTYNNNDGYENFGSYGDVILYKPFGKDGIRVIHRAIMYVEKDESMWEGGPSAPHAGYITKGDNIATNPMYDQQGSMSYQQPVKREWITGIAKFRIPYIGYIRLALPI